MRVAACPKFGGDGYQVAMNCCIVAEWIFRESEFVKPIVERSVFEPHVFEDTLRCHLRLARLVLSGLRSSSVRPQSKLVVEVV